MGNFQSEVFSQTHMEDYLDSTFFSKSEIIKVYKKFKSLDPEAIPSYMTRKDTKSIKISHLAIENMPELKYNPFKRQICEVFASDPDGDMTFDDFLDMFSVFSESAPRDLKSIYAFKIYDFDKDGIINKQDLIRTINCLTINELDFEEVDYFSDKVVEEIDFEDNGVVTLSEFQQAVSRAPDFVQTFHIRLQTRTLLSTLKVTKE